MLSCTLLCLLSVVAASERDRLSCDLLLPCQYSCWPVQLDPDTDLPVNCDQAGYAMVLCTPADGLVCQGLTNGTFVRSSGQRCPGRKSFKLALVLSIFFGWAGLDRFYLGYVTIGLFKLSTLGFFFIFHLLDIILIALQIVQPSDGSAYRMDRYGPRVQRNLFTNSTQIRPADY